MSILDDYLKDLAPLVNLDCGTATIPGVTRAAEIMKGYFDSIGFTTEIVDLGDKAGHALIARNKPDADHIDVLLNGHLDTVFPEGTAAARPFTVEGDVARGPGCSDCKGGVLAAYYACKLADPKDLERLSICCAFNPDEETGSKNSHEWLAKIGEKAKCALIVEAARAGGELVRSRKGVGDYTVTFHGRSAHAGNNPEAGCNANIAAMRFALAAYELADKEVGTTVNPGVVKGGTAVNVIPDLATVQIDIRYWFDEDGDKLEAGLRELASRTWVEGVTQDFVRSSRMPAMPLSEATKGLVAKITEAAKMAGFDAKWVDAGGGSDGNRIAKAGIPVVDGCGPAGANFHTDREYLRLDTVEERIAMLVNFFKLV
ncbi:M20 family metallopeptidase [Sutterella sp.]|uniref:M20 family metallopeptidase n=1 Tax=Sutterella sp. TaxID=1981025 RepID=UPI0026E054D4|nr:M20 family metallopeptidase [Sutterella sp.]MDO5530567.1 M20 family metallopeptidase [Sutterella sp.]